MVDGPMGDRSRQEVGAMQQATVEDEDLESDPGGLKSRRVLRSRRRDRDYRLRRVLLAGDMAALSLALLVALLAAGDRDTAPRDAVWFLATLPAWAFLFNSYQLYKRPLQSLEPTHLDDLPRLFHAMIVGTLALWVFYKVIPPAQLNLAEVAIFWFSAMVLIVLFRRVARSIQGKRQDPERVYLVATEEDLLSMKRRLGYHPEYQLELVGATTDESIGEPSGALPGASLAEIRSRIEMANVDLLLVRLDLACLAEGASEELMYWSLANGIRYGTYPGPRSMLLPGAHLSQIEGMGILVHDLPVLSRSNRVMKRALDLALSSLALVVAAPLMMTVALVIRLDSKGPVFFRQPRIGKDGEPFALNKFRTMVPDADEMVDELMEQSADPDWLDLDEDPRITRVGGFLRRTSLDELPQLWNVFKGEMSLVGPRPLSLRDSESLRGRQRNRLDLVPGVTGYWQVLGRTSIPFKEMVEIDYAYVTGWSLWLDLKILMRTVPVVFGRRGAN